jgi:hypothetical protein
MDRLGRSPRRRLRQPTSGDLTDEPSTEHTFCIMGALIRCDESSGARENNVTQLKRVIHPARGV